MEPVAVGVSAVAPRMTGFLECWACRQAFPTASAMTAAIQSTAGPVLLWVPHCGWRDLRVLVHHLGSMTYIRDSVSSVPQLRDM